MKKIEMADVMNAMVVVLLLFSFSFSLATWMEVREQRREINAVVKALKQKPPPLAPTNGEAKAKEEKKMPADNNALILATVRKGEGIEHAFIRQLKENPALYKFHRFTGDPANTAAFTRWAGGEAHRIAIGAKYYDDLHGAEIRVAREGTAYLLQKDGDNLRVQVTIASAHGSHGTVLQARTVADSNALSAFQHNPIVNAPIYEYLFDGG